ncbi:TetR family transcriptional regulator [Pseudonocardia xishanensis]|uniref:TetR family transcriptional regulator n=1 Tax=Pseudonocardia xishanensis TaxID=630995 RepID=A0ABP8RRW8_9PSEU
MSEPSARSGSEPEPRRRGRRTSGEDTRAALLAAARAEFTERGFEGATVRRIAERASVDPAMVNHWFGGKEALFTATLELPVDPGPLVRAAADGDPATLGERIVALFLQVWDVGPGGGPMIALLRSVAAHPSAVRMIREFVSRTILRPFVTPVAPDRADERAALVASQMLGLGMIRYVVQLEPLASADHTTIVALIGPTVQRYLTGPLPEVRGRDQGPTRPDS